MLKKILIGLGILVIVFVAFMLSYFFYFTRLASPEANLHFENQHVQIDLNYCQPSKNGRFIFGEKSNEALVPYGEYWRLGANQSTEIEFKQAVLFKNKEVAAGRYRMYAIPEADSWNVRLNSQLDEWGASKPDDALDIVEVNCRTIKIPEVELFTISLDEYTNGALLIMKWDQTSVEIPITSTN